MNRKCPESNNFDLNTFLDSSGDCEENNVLHWNFNPDKNETLYAEEKTEILWSREKKHFFSDKDFFNNGHDSFFDLSEKSASSGSWHNDDFDVKSSNKVSKSLEAVEDALYEKKNSPFISEEVYQECNNWSNKFPFLRIKGERIPNSEDIILTSCQMEEYMKYDSLSLQVEGKRMSLHAPEKSFRKTNLEIPPESSESNYIEEIILCHDENRSVNISERENQNLDNFQSADQMPTADSVNYDSIQEKVIENLAQHIWPKVLEYLQNCGEAKKLDKSIEDIQLPPIFAIRSNQALSVPNQRPKTEGYNLSTVDFPKLNSFLSVSPKILQDRKECRSGRQSSLRSSRPNSEIHSRRNNFLSLNANKVFSQNTSKKKVPNSSLRQLHFVAKKAQKKEDNDKMSLYLPALEEDISDPVDYLKGLSLQNENKTVTTSLVAHFPKKPECFLPPIDADNLNPDLKLTRNLFTFFGSDVKCANKGDTSYKPKTPASRPNTCASKKSQKQSDNFSFKFMNDGFSSFKNSNCAEIKRIEDSSDKQVTLFPIVTSLVPGREKNCRSAKKSKSISLQFCMTISNLAEN